MVFTDDLLPASFRNVRFHVENTSIAVGRRLANFEYPSQDTPYAEDLGRKQRLYSITGYIVGDDWISQQKALETALQDKGPGLLVHPVAGEVTVAVENGTLDFDRTEGRMIRFQAVFIETGQRQNPTQSINTAQQIAISAVKALAAILTQFTDDFTTKGFSGFLSDNATTQFSSMADQVNSISGSANATGDASDELAAETESFKAGIDTSNANALGSGSLSVVAGLGTAVDSAERILSLTSFGDDIPAVSETTSSRKQEAKNQAATITIVKRAAIIETAKSAASIKFSSKDDAVLFRDKLISEMDSEIIAAGDADQRESWAALTDLKAKVIEDLNQRAASLGSITEVDINENTPALVMANRIYGDATRTNEIVERNKIKHSGFIPVGFIEVISG